MLTTNSSLPTDKETAEARAKLDALYSDIEKAELQVKEFNDLTDQVKALEEQKVALSDSVKESETAQATLVFKQKELEDLNAQITEAKVQGTIALENLKAELIKTKKELETLSNEIVKSKVVLSTVQSESETKIASIEADRVALEEKIKALEIILNELQVKQEVANQNLSTIADLVKAEEAKIDVLKSEKILLERSLDTLQAQLDELKQAIEAETVRHNEVLEANKVIEEEQAKKLVEIETSLLERSKDLDIREIHLSKVEKKLISYKGQLEEHFGKRFDDLII